MGRSKKGKCKSVVDVKSLKNKKRYLVAPKKTTQDSSVQFQDTQLKVPLTNTTETIQQLVMPPSKENEELNNYEFYENEISASSLDEISSDAECSNIFYKDMNFQTLESFNKADKSLEELFEERPLSDTDEDDDQSDEAHFNSKLTEEEKLKTELRDWHKKYAVTNVALCALLLILRSHSCFSNLPKSDKSLLHTPRDLKYAEMGPGLYYHIGLVRTLNRVLSFIKEKVTHLRLKIGIDEVPIFKSVPSGMIPIMISFSGIQSLRKVVLPIGIYYGPAKASVTKFLKPFVDEATTVLKNGLDFQGSKVKVEVEGFICDTPAKAYILNTKGHRGYSSCTKCKASGVDYMRRMTFPTNEKITLYAETETTLKAVAETKVSNTIQNMLQKIFTDELAVSFCLAGKSSEKKVFETYFLYNTVLECTKAVYPAELKVETDARDSMSTWFTQAKHRIKKRQERARRKEMRSLEKLPQAASITFDSAAPKTTDAAAPKKTDAAAPKKTDAAAPKTTDAAATKIQVEAEVEKDKQLQEAKENDSIVLN